MAQPLKLLDTGRLNMAWFHSRSRVELDAWLRDLVHGREREFVGGRESEPEYLLDEVYQDASAEGRALIAEILCDFLAEAQRGVGGWNTESLHRILFVATSTQSRLVAMHVRRMAESGHYLDPETGAPTATHIELLRTLAGLPRNTSSEFWRREVARDPEELLVTGFMAESRHSLVDAFRLLEQFPEWRSNPTVESRLSIALEMMRQEFGEEAVREAADLTRSRRGKRDAAPPTPVRVESRESEPKH